MKQPTTPTTPFAMRCTQEQFESIREEIEKNGGRIVSISDFEWTIFPYLTNSFNDTLLEFGSTVVTEGRTVYETFDKKILFKCCGWEEKELIGYKINPESPITAEELGRLLNCSRREVNGLFFSVIDFDLSSAYSRADQLGIVGEGKWLVPVYKQKESEIEIRWDVPDYFKTENNLTEHYDIIDLKPLPQSEVDRIKEATFIRGTPEWQKSVREIDVTKEPVSEQLIRTLNDDEVLSLTQNCKLNISDYVKYLSFKKGRFWNNNTDTTNMKPTQCGGRITGTYEQQKGGGS